MAGTMRKMAVYLGLVEDQNPYGDEYEYEDDVDGRHDPHRDSHREGHRDERPTRAVAAVGAAGAMAPMAGQRVAQRSMSSAELSRITTLHPRTYNEARTIGEHFRDGTPVIMNLTEMDDSDAKRLVDFAAGLIFGLHGSIERVTQKVFLLSPANVTVTAEDKARIAEGGFFNQS
jgi:cell division inhibitor SepF